MAKRDYYDVLGVSRTASSDQIRTAYRKLARKYHPDVNKAGDAATKFKEATEAYEVISDADKRQKYDQFGHAGPGMPFGGQGAPGSGPGGGRTYTWNGRPDEGYGGQGGVDFEDLFGQQGGGGGFSGMSLDDILASLGAGRRPRRGRAAAPQSAPQDMQHEVTLDFMQAVRGTTIGLRLQSPDGRGGETIDVKIPPGVSEGSKIRLRGKGFSGGDLYLITHIREHPYFRRDGADIYVDVPISITEAALGAKVDVPTLDGTSTVTVPPGSSSGRNLRLRGKGLASAGGASKGDQYVVLKVVVPPTISPQAAQLLRQFSEIEPFDPRWCAVEIDEEESFILARHRVYRFAAMLAFLVLMSSALGMMLYLSSTAASQASAGVAKVRASQPAATSQSDAAVSQDATTKTLAGSAKFLARLAGLSAALLGLTLLVLFWVVAHFVLQRIGRNAQHTRTQYVNAWSLAGQRVKPLEEEDLDADADDDEGGKDDDEDEDSGENGDDEQD